MAEEIGVTSEQLKSYESGRVPLPYWFASKLCRRFGVNPVWLAEAAEIVHVGYETLLEPSEEAKVRQERFSLLFTMILSSHVFGKEAGAGRD